MLWVSLSLPWKAGAFRGPANPLRFAREKKAWGKKTIRRANCAAKEHTTPVQIRAAPIFLFPEKQRKENQASDCPQNTWKVAEGV